MSRWSDSVSLTNAEASLHRQGIAQDSELLKTKEVAMLAETNGTRKMCGGVGTDAYLLCNT